MSEAQKWRGIAILWMLATMGQNLADHSSLWWLPALCIGITVLDIIASWRTGK